MYVLGEIENISGSVLHAMQVTAEFRDGSGNPVRSATGYPYLPNLAPGAKTCFEVFLTQPANWATYSLRPLSYQTDGVMPPNLAVFDDYSWYDPDFGSYQVDGSLRNDQGTRVGSIKVVGTLYRSGDRVAGCDFTYMSGSSLNPGQAGAFSLLFSNRDYGDILKYRVQVDGVVQPPAGPGRVP